MIGKRYAGGEDSEVGDVVECVESKDTPYDVSVRPGDQYRVVKFDAHHVWLNGQNWGFWKSRFKLIKRQEKAVSTLVKWPAEQPLLFSHLAPGDWFVFVDYPQLPCVRLNDGRYVSTLASGFDAWTMLGSSGSAVNQKPVRRLKNPLPEKYEVI